MRLIAKAMVLAAFTASVLILALAGCGGGDSASQSERDKAITAAKFLLAGQTNRALIDGPCLSESLPGMSDWAVDVAHDPRKPVDDLPANQCQSVRDGRTHHFVEVTPDGKLIQAR